MRPPYSLDLNPIETVWNWTKDWIQDNYEEQFSYDTLRVAVKEAWDAITELRLPQLLQEMRDTRVFRYWVISIQAWH
jgi:hypothetical protein